MPVSAPHLEATGAGVEATREQLLEAAARLFAERGYHHTTVEDVVAAAGLAKGTVYWYWRSKKALFLAVLERAASVYAGELLRATGSERSPLRRISRAIDGTFAFARRHPGLCRLYFQQVLSDDEDFVARRAKIYAEFVRGLKREIREAIRARELPSQDPDLAAQMVVGTVEAGVRAALDGSRRSRAGQELRAFVEGGLKR